MLRAHGRGVTPGAGDRSGRAEEIECGRVARACRSARPRPRPGGGRSFPTSPVGRFPFRTGGPVFMREAAESHRDSSPSTPTPTVRTFRTKLERCFAVSDAEFETGLRQREDYRSVPRGDGGVRLLVTPTLSIVAPPRAYDLEIRDAMLRSPIPSTSRLAALALPCGPAKTGSRPPPARRPSGQDARVIAAGRLLEPALAGRSAPAGDPAVRAEVHE